MPTSTSILENITVWPVLGHDASPPNSRKGGNLPKDIIFTTPLHTADLSSDRLISSTSGLNMLSPFALHRQGDGARAAKSGSAIVKTGDRFCPRILDEDLKGMFKLLTEADNEALSFSERDFECFDFKTLIYIFYQFPGDKMHRHAAMQLYERKWKYHKELQVWFNFELNSLGTLWKYPRYVYMDPLTMTYIVFEYPNMFFLYGFMSKAEIMLPISCN